MVFAVTVEENEMTSKKILAIGIALVLFAFIVLNTNIYHFNDSLGM